MQKTPKLWLGLGVFVTAAAAVTVTAPTEFALVSPALAAEGGEGGEGGESGASAAGEKAGADVGFQGDLPHALEKIFAGEGGEGGAGLTTMWPRISAPALTGDQVRMTITGNSIRSDEHHAFYFDKNGTVEGWYATWAKGPDAKACPKTEVAGDNFFRAGEACYLKTVVNFSGPWRISNHQVCASINWMGKTQDPCWHVALLLDRVALFAASGKLEGKGNDLVRGKVLGQLAK